MGKIETRAWITRKMLRAEPDKLFVFGDNMQRVGMGGQAKEMRGEPNAVGIPTKHSPGTGPYDYFTDDDIIRVSSTIIKEVVRLRSHLRAGGTVVWPGDGIGTGLADLTYRAPAIMWLIESLRTGLEQVASDHDA